MTFDAFSKALTSCNLLPDVVIRHAIQVAQSLDDGARSMLFHDLRQEYGQYESLVQRKLIRMEHMIAEAGTRRKPHVSRKDVEQGMAATKHLGGLM